MKEKAFLPKKESEEELVSGIRQKPSLRLPSVPGLQRTISEKKPPVPEGTLRDDAFKLTGQAALKLTSLEMKLKKKLRSAKNEEVREEIQGRLDQCEDLARMLNTHIKDIVEQDAKISQESKPAFNYDPELYKKIIEAQRKEQATRKLKVHPGLAPLLREINEFIEDSSETPESLSRAA